MDSGKFYFISEDYFEKFEGMGLMENSETVDGKPHGRPCFYAFKDSQYDIYWMIPISSKIGKYEREYRKAIDKYGFCDGISFGYVLGEKKAFLVQNMLPVTDKYITNIYIDRNTSNPISVPTRLQSELNAKIRKAVRLYRRGVKIVLSNALDIEKVLIIECELQQAQEQAAPNKEE